MKWITRTHLHLDRTASAWLIRRFIDRSATFEFVGWEPDPIVPDDAIPFALPGRELGPHDEHGTVFEKLLRKHELRDPAFREMGLTISAGVRWALKLEPGAGQTSAHTAVGRALDGLGAAMGIFNDDPQILRDALPIYDALYLWCQMRTTDDSERLQMPRSPLERQRYWRHRLHNPTAHVGLAAPAPAP